MPSSRPQSHISLAVLVAVLVLSLPAAVKAEGKITRTASGHPNLSGNYNAATLTPLQRPTAYGDTLLMTKEEAQKIADDQASRIDKTSRDTDPNREAPPVGGAAVVGFEDTPDGGNRFGAGNVGGYNWFWIDQGSDAFNVDGKFRTSILIDPKNGRMPERTEAARQARAERGFVRRQNDGTAWWLENDGPGPYDNIETRSRAERCITGFTGATPTFPSLYNNYKRIVQTEDHVMILIEMVHDARIVRMKAEGRTVEHPSADVRKWLGDSIGWWEGDALVVDTTNFRPDNAPRGGSENAHVVERFTPLENGDLLYRFTVQDDTVWEAPWTGEYVWRASEEKVYEYACHEGNYAMGNILRGARLLEREALEP